jgi:signal transduction histidine kinase
MMILMTLSIMFSVIIYQVAFSAIKTHLEHFRISMQQSSDLFGPPVNDIMLRNATSVEKATSDRLILELLYLNLLVLVSGGFISYYLARRSLEPIEKVHEAQSRFTSDASHELRTPLAAMKAEIEVALRDNNATENELKQVLSSNLEEVDKLTKLSEMLLNLSRADHNKLKTGPVNLNKITQSTIKSFRQPPERIKFNSGKAQVIVGNEVAIAELIKILVDNALQYSPDDSQISINISRENEFVKFEIINNGPGIHQDKLPYIFDRFYRADSSRTNGGQKGYGLGLAIAKSITELHGGRISVVSTPDHETTFMVFLPLHLNSQAKNKN